MSRLGSPPSALRNRSRHPSLLPRTEMPVTVTSILSCLASSGRNLTLSFHGLSIALSPFVTTWHVFVLVSDLGYTDGRCGHGGCWQESRGAIECRRRKQGLSGTSERATRTGMAATLEWHSENDSFSEMQLEPDCSELHPESDHRSSVFVSGC